jgi:hypothetical protein
MPGSGSNAALDAILADYQRYHAVLVVVASILLVAVGALVVLCWRGLRAAGRSTDGRTRRQTWTYAAFITGGILVGLFLALVLVANLSTVISPERGFAGVDQSGEAFTAWVASGSASIPDAVQERVDARLAWQRPKAVIVTLLLLITVLGSVAIWRRWLRHAYASRGANALLLASGTITVVIALLLMLMVMGNVQASLAPVAITLVYG